MPVMASSRSECQLSYNYPTSYLNKPQAYQVHQTGRLSAWVDQPPYADLRIYADLLCDLLSWRRWLRSLFSWQPWDFPWGFLALSFCNDFLVSWVPGLLATWFAGFLGWFTAPQLWMTRLTPERRRVGLALRRWDADGKDEWSIEGATQI